MRPSSALAALVVGCTAPVADSPGPCPEGYVRGEANLCLLVPTYLNVATQGDADEFCRWHDRVQGDVVITTEEDELPALPCLREIDGDLLIREQPGIASARLDALERVGGSVHVSNNPVLESLSLPALREVGQDLAVEYNPIFHGIEIPVLETVGSDIWLYQNMRAPDGGPDGPQGDPQAYWSFDVPALATVGRNVYIRLNWLLEGVSFPQLTEAGGLFKLTGNEQLLSVDLPSLDFASGFWVSFNRELRSVDLPELEVLDGELFHLEATGLREAFFPHLSRVPSVEFMENRHQVNFELPALVAVQGHVDVRDNPGLQSMHMWQLASVGADFRVQRNPLLPTSDVEEIIALVGPENIGGNIVVEDNGAD